MDFSDTAFRSIEQWKSALIKLPDTRFFDIMRGIFGTIQSPFNKQRLLDELAVFLSTSSIQETIASYLDDDDHKIIAAVAALNEPERRDLGKFFSGEYSYIKLDSLVSNLEDRLIIYTLEESGRLSLNPLLKKILAPFTADNDILFPRRKIQADRGQTAVVYDDIFLASFLTFISPKKHIIKQDGSIQKNLTQKIQKIFPLQENGTGVFVTALRYIGLLPDGSFDPNGKKLQDFARLTEAERFAYCAAGVYISVNSGAKELFLPQKKNIQHIAAAAMSLYNTLDDDYIYPESTPRRLIQVNQAAAGSTLRANEQIEAGILLEAMEKTGLLLKENDGYRRRIITGNRNRIDGIILPSIAFNSIFSFIILPEITFSEITELAPFCELAAPMPPAQFKITQESAVRGFNSGINSKTMFELLKKLSCGRIESGLEAILDDWEKRHSEIIIMEGMSLVLSEGQRYIARTESLVPHIVFSPSPGVYLLDFTDKDEAVTALKKAGAGIVSEQCARPAALSQKKSAPFFVSFPQQAKILSEESERHTADTWQRRSGEEYKKYFREELDKLNPSKLEREELTARIDKKIVISPNQLNGAFIRYEKREARGLDYAGKIALVKQALISNETLEITVQDSDGSEKYIAGAPIALEKLNDETILSVKQPQTDIAGKIDDNINDSGCIKISIGKIRVIRRIKQ
jgi:hypothetical protein